MKVIVTDYNPAWPEAFEREAAALRSVFGELLVAIHHIGSTAVPGLKAKPVIDIMPIVTDISAVDALVEQMSTCLRRATRTRLTDISRCGITCAHTRTRWQPMAP